MLGELEGVETERTERVVVEVGVVPAGRARASSRGRGVMGGEVVTSAPMKPSVASSDQKALTSGLKIFGVPSSTDSFNRSKVMEKPTCTDGTWKGSSMDEGCSPRRQARRGGGVAPKNKSVDRARPGRRRCTTAYVKMQGWGGRSRWP